MHIIGSLRYGGAEKFLVNLIKNLDKDRFSIIVCCLGGGGPLEQELVNIKGVEIIKLNIRRQNLPIALYRLFRAMKARKIKVVHTHLFMCGFYGRLIARLAGVPVLVTHEHGMTRWKKRRHITFERWANRFTDIRVAASESIRRDRIERERTDPEKIITIYNGIDTGYFNPALWKRELARQQLGLAMDAFCIGTVARLVPPKGLPVLLQALKRTCKKIPTTYLALIGDGPLKENLQQYSREIGIDDRVLFVGYRQDVPNLLAAMDIFVLSSVIEGMPISLLEAMAMQKPVVATRVGGIPEAVREGIDGFLTPPGDPIQLSDAIVELLDKPELRNNMGLSARQRVFGVFSVESMARKIEDLYSKLLERKETRSWSSLVDDGMRRTIFDFPLPPAIANKRWQEFERAFRPGCAGLEEHQREISTIWKELNLKPGDRVLEIGGGLGLQSLELASRGADCTDLDIVKENVELVSYLAKQFQLNLKVVYGDCCRLPFEDGMFDAVFAKSTFEHIRDQEAALDEVERVLSPGGRLLIIDGNLLCPTSLIHMLFIRPCISRGKSGGIRWLLTKGKVHKAYGMGWPGKDEDMKTLWWWRQSIVRRSLTLIKLTTSRAYLNPHNLVFRLLAPFAGLNMVVAEKREQQKSK